MKVTGSRQNINQSFKKLVAILTTRTKCAKPREHAYVQHYFMVTKKISLRHQGVEVACHGTWIKGRVRLI